MALRIPTAQDLRRLAEANDFDLSEEELTAFQEYIPSIFADNEALLQWRQ